MDVHTDIHLRDMGGRGREERGGGGEEREKEKGRGMKEGRKKGGIAEERRRKRKDGREDVCHERYSGHPFLVCIFESGIFQLRGSL